MTYQDAKAELSRYNSLPTGSGWNARVAAEMAMKANALKWGQRNVH